MPAAPAPSSDGTVPAPVLAKLAECIHLGHEDPPAGSPAARFVSLVAADGDHLDVGFWDLPVEQGGTADPLVGFRAPRSWAAVGLVTAGPMVTVTLWPRHGEVVSFLGPPGSPGEPIVGRPAGVVPDVLARVLGQATPPPCRSTAAFVDLTWLERLATAHRRRPGRPRSWRWLADHHPLRGTGPTPPPAELADRARAYAEERSWAAFLDRHRSTPLPAAVWGPPGGEVLPLGAWFDAGSICRWVLRALPPADVLLGDLLAGLAPAQARQVVAALAETEVAADR